MGKVVFAFGALMVALVLASCGGEGGTPLAVPSATLSTTPAATNSPRTSPSVSGDPSSRPGATAPSTPAGIRTTGSPSPSGRATGGSTGRLSLACARRGVDTQTITIRTTPDGSAGFNTIYSDGSSNIDTPYSSGFGGGFADSSGMWAKSWVVPENAPTGLATVRVAVQDGFFDLSYTVVAANGSCP